MTIRVALAGSTGSIGTQTIDVVDATSGDYQIVALGASGRNPEPLIRQVRHTGATVLAVDGDQHVDLLRAELPDIDLRVGKGALASLAELADVVVNGVVGFAGLEVTVSTLEAGRRLALANKESLISGGPVVQRARRTPGAELVPVDSEHCAIHQCLRANTERHRVESLVLTASGGPFRGRHHSDLDQVTVAEALDHPTWAMGPKITIDSSTLMNKGLEVIEAVELFGAPAGPAGFGLGYDDISVVVHPQSIVHSMVGYSDGSTIAQLSEPDMRMPIGYALAYPDRLRVPFGTLDWSEARSLDFEPPDRETFRCLDLAFAAGRSGETAPAWLNGANEAVVGRFLAGELRWVEIAEILEEVLEKWDGTPADSIEAVVGVDQRARDCAMSLVDARLSA